MINLQVATQFIHQISDEFLIKTAQSVIDKHAIEQNLEMTIVIDEDQTIHQLNRDYLGIDTPTDVLSFYAHELDPDTGNIYLGDVIVSLPRAKVQAEIAGHSLETEILLLVIHGTLHLLGYDHDTFEKKSEMWLAQQSLLDQLGIEINQLPEA